MGISRLTKPLQPPTSQPTRKMKTIFVLAYLATVTLAQRRKLPAFQAAAAAPSEEACDCQCSSLIFRDTRGRVQGNCKTTYNGAQWCYVNPRYTNCRDLTASSRFRGKYWSYQACATPGLDEYPCYNYRYGDDTPFVRTAGGAAAAKPANSDI